MTTASRFGLATVFAIIALLPARAEAVSYTFSYCFNNNSGVCDQLADQLKVEVTDAGGGYVNFTFTNDGAIESSITGLYFDADGFLTSMTVLSQSGGVDFLAGYADPDNVSGGQTAIPPFEITAGLLAGSSDPMKPQKGINSVDDQLTLQFKIDDGLAFADIVKALDLGPNEGNGIRIAAHVQGINGSQSDTFICCDGLSSATLAPEPAVLALFGLGLFAIGFRVRRRRPGPHPES